mmetsp:Transcript_4185/g.9597  ORF Transcript_4185/g.9597 Transcript_4185/m.9597 type:complete len:292 (+) Transcript_4185:56-931(+)
MQRLPWAVACLCAASGRALAVQPVADGVRALEYALFEKVVHKELRNRAEGRTWEYPFLHKIVSKQETVTLVDIGACVGDFNSNSNVEPVQGILRSEKVRAVLVEPNPRAFDQLKEKVQGLHNNTDRIQLVEAAITNNRNVSTVPFYVLSPDVVKDDVGNFLLNQVSSMSKRQLLQSGIAWKMNETQLEKYVQEIQVPAKTPLKLLQDAGVDPSKVDVLKVDAEGYDAIILNAFLSIPGFNPKAIIFEALHLGQSRKKQIIERLNDAGYTTSCKRCFAPMDVTAVKEQYLGL